MTRQSALAALVAALLIALGSEPLLAQSTTEGTETEQVPATEGAQAESAEPAVVYDAETVIATANGVEITLGELIALRQGLPEQYQNLPGEVLSVALRDQITTQTLLAEAARKAGLEGRRDVRLALRAQTQALLAETYVRDQVTERVTEESIEAAYQERYVDAPPKTQRHASHILVETEELALEMKQKIDEGADFAVLAAENGTDGTAQRGGDLGWFAHSDMVPEFADATFAMEPEQVSDPVKSTFGWHLIKLHGERQSPVPPIEDVYSDLISALADEAQRAAVEEVTEGATIENAEIELPNDAIKDDSLLLPAE